MALFLPWRITSEAEVTFLAGEVWGMFPLPPLPRPAAVQVLAPAGCLTSAVIMASSSQSLHSPSHRAGITV